MNIIIFTIIFLITIKLSRKLLRRHRKAVRQSTRPLIKTNVIKIRYKQVNINDLPKEFDGMMILGIEYIK
jgi:hypothetical protein